MTTKYKPHYKVHRNKLTGNYWVMLYGTKTIDIIRGVPAGTTKVHYYTGTVWYPTLRDAIFSLI